MLAVIAKLNVNEGKEAEVEAVMLELAAQVRANEPGNELYTLVKDNEDGSYYVMELYADQAAMDAHGQSEHFKAAGPKFGGLMGGPPEIKRLTVVG